MLASFCGFGRKQALQVCILRTGRVLAPGRTEGDQPGMGQVQLLCLLKKLHILGVTAGVAGLYVLDAQFIKGLDDVYLVLYRITDALTLRTVAESGIQKLYVLHGSICHADILTEIGENDNTVNRNACA